MSNKTVDRELINEAILALGKAYNNPTVETIDKIIGLLKKSSTESAKPGIIKASSVVLEKNNFISLGVDWFDKWFNGGIRPQELLLYGATPHAGKTHLLVWTGAQFLLEGYRVLSIIGEDLLSDVKSYYSIAVHGTDAINNLWFADMQDVRFGVREVEEVYELLVKQSTPPEIIIIDHVDLMKSYARDKADWERVSDIMTDLKLFAKRTNTILITASQMNFSRDIIGMERFYRAKVGKTATADLIITVDSVLDEEYEVSLQKARGRRVLFDDRKKILKCNWDMMQIEDITHGQAY